MMLDLPRSHISSHVSEKVMLYLHMRNSEYSSTHLVLTPPQGKVTGLPARVRRDLASAIGIRKAGQVLPIYLLAQRQGSVLVSYGRAVAKIVCATA
jgi:hypothetical protein